MSSTESLAFPRPRGSVALRPETSTASCTRFVIVDAGQEAGWIELTGSGPVRRLTGEVFPRFVGRGVATAAVHVACRISHSAMAVAGLEALVAGRSAQAHRVLEANGFICADLRREPLLFELDLARWAESPGPA